MEFKVPVNLTGTPNKNGVVFSEKALHEAVEKFNAKTPAMGELQPREPGLTVELSNVSHVIQKLTLEDGKVMGEIKVLSTPMGRVVQDIISDTYDLSKVSFNMRGRVPSKAEFDEDGNRIIKELEIISIDIGPAL